MAVACLQPFLMSLPRRENVVQGFIFYSDYFGRFRRSSFLLSPRMWRTNLDRLITIGHGWAGKRVNDQRVVVSIRDPDHKFTYSASFRGIRCL